MTVKASCSRFVNVFDLRTRGSLLLLRISVFAVLLFILTAASAAPLSGTKAIGPTGNYTSITAAIADVQAQGLSGPLVLELQSSYVSSVETFPLTFANLGSTASNTITLRPHAIALNRVISSATTTAATIDLNGAAYVTIDGRPGGAGTAKQLTIANTDAGGVALRFVNEARNNTVRYVTLQGANTSASSGTVAFGATTGANGNDSNTIDYCDVRDGVGTPVNGIYSLGGIATTAQNNSGNTISNCNIFNFYSPANVDSTGVRLDAGNTGWTITGNNFYQTAVRPAVSAVARAVFVNSIGNSFVITNNAIGGTLPGTGGFPWQTTGTSLPYAFAGIHLNVGTTTPSSVQGNTIRNFVWTTSNSFTDPIGKWTGIYVQAGSANVGGTMGNLIGSGTGTQLITATGGAGGTFGIASTSTGAVAIANNTIGSITAYGGWLTGILAVGTVSGNTVGSVTTANSLNMATPSSYSVVVGIQAGGLIRNNLVANLNNASSADLGGVQIVGIQSGGSSNIVTENVVRNLTTPSPTSGDGSSSSVVGISLSGAAPGQMLTRNLVHSLSNTNANASVSVAGIAYNGTGGTNVIANNIIHSLTVSSNSAFSAIVGMDFNIGAFTAVGSPGTELEFAL